MKTSRGRRGLRAIVAEPTRPISSCFPKARLTGYFLEGAVYDLALPATALPTISRAMARGVRRRRSISSGFYENDHGTYYNSAIYLRGRAHGPRASCTCTARCSCRPTASSTRNAFFRAGGSMQAFETRFGRAAMLICEDAWHAIVPAIAAIKGARVLIVPARAGARHRRRRRTDSITRWREILRASAAEHGVYLLYAGLTGFEGGKGMTGSSCDHRSARRRDRARRPESASA